MFTSLMLKVERSHPHPTKKFGFEFLVSLPVKPKMIEEIKKSKGSARMRERIAVHNFLFLIGM